MEVMTDSGKSGISTPTRKARLQIYLLGTFHATLDSEPLRTFDSDKSRALLAYLAVEAKESHRREQLVGLLWPEMPEKRARASLSQALYNLRTLLGDQDAEVPFLDVSRTTIQFNPESDTWLDLGTIHRLHQAVESHDHDMLEKCDTCIDALQQAVSLYRGEFLTGFYVEGLQAFQEWCLVVREKLHRKFLAILQKLAATYEACGKLDAALECAHRLVDLDPFAEAPQRQLMRLLLADGQSVAALAQFENHRRSLLAELGVEPAPETVDLYEQVRAAQATHRDSQMLRHNLPQPLTAFIGRQAELSELRACLENADCRLLTILGPGGSGKTRLALEVARAQLGNFSHGVYWIPLNPVQSTEAILPTMVKALKLPAQEKGEMQEQLTNYLRAKKMLLVMDAYEHLLSGAELLPEILRAAPGMKVLVTSRSKLKIKCEHVYPLDGMHYPDPETSLAEAVQYGSVKLFLSGARRVNLNYAPTETELEAIIRICQLAEGLPLGILLAAAWMAEMSATEIAAQVERGLDILSSQWIDVPARQLSLRATLDYAMRILDRREQEIFYCLSVFHGGFTRTAAGQVCQAKTDELYNLAEKSLLYHTPDNRYQIHELTRQYGAEQLDGYPNGGRRFRDQHASFYCQSLGKWAQVLKSPAEETTLEEMDIEHENIRAAWHWAADQGVWSHIGIMLEGLCLYYQFRGRFREGLSACQFAFKKLSNDNGPVERVNVLAHLRIWQSKFERALGRHQLAQELIEASQNLLEQAKTGSLESCQIEAQIYQELGYCQMPRDSEVARRYYIHSLASYEKINDLWSMGVSMINLGVCSLRTGDIDKAQNWFESSLEILREHGAPRILSSTLRSYSFLNYRKGVFAKGFDLMNEAAEIRLSMVDLSSQAHGLKDKGLAYSWLGRYSEAIPLFSRSITLFEELNNCDEIAFLYVALGMLKTLAGRYAEANPDLLKGHDMACESARGNKRLIGASKLAFGWLAIHAGEFERAVEYLHESISIYRQVKFLDELGWALAALGYAVFAQGRSGKAISYLIEGLRIGVDHQMYHAICHALAPLAYFIRRSSDPKKSLEIYTVATQNPVVANSTWFDDVYGKPIAALAEALPLEIAVAVKKRGLERDPWQTATELLEEFCPKE